MKSKNLLPLISSHEEASVLKYFVVTLVTSGLTCLLCFVIFLAWKRWKGNINIPTENMEKDLVFNRDINRNSHGKIRRGRHDFGYRSPENKISKNDPRLRHTKLEMQTIDAIQMLNALLGVDQSQTYVPEGPITLDVPEFVVESHIIKKSPIRTSLDSKKRKESERYIFKKESFGEAEPDTNRKSATSTLVSGQETVSSATESESYLTGLAENEGEKYSEESVQQSDNDGLDEEDDGGEDYDENEYGSESDVRKKFANSRYLENNEDFDDNVGTGYNDKSTSHQEQRFPDSTHTDKNLENLRFSKNKDSLDKSDKKKFRSEFNVNSKNQEQHLSFRAQSDDKGDKNLEKCRYSKTKDIDDNNKKGFLCKFNGTSKSHQKQKVSSCAQTDARVNKNLKSKFKKCICSKNDVPGRFYDELRSYRADSFAKRSSSYSPRTPNKEYPSHEESLSNVDPYIWRWKRCSCDGFCGETRKTIASESLQSRVFGCCLASHKCCPCHVSCAPNYCYCNNNWNNNKAINFQNGQDSSSVTDTNDEKIDSIINMTMNKREESEENLKIIKNNCVSEDAPDIQTIIVYLTPEHDTTKQSYTVQSRSDNDPQLNKKSYQPININPSLDQKDVHMFPRATFDLDKAKLDLERIFEKYC